MHVVWTCPDRPHNSPIFPTDQLWQLLVNGLFPFQTGAGYSKMILFQSHQLMIRNWQSIKWLNMLKYCTYIIFIDICNNFEIGSGRFEWT